MSELICKLTKFLNCAGDYVALLPLRLVLAWTFWEAGVRKLGGENWFGDIAHEFPFPFNILPIDLSWFLATWTEILGAIGLLLGLVTRFWVAALIILDIVAWVSVHGGNGYNVCDNGFKLPLLYLTMMIPLLMWGAGKISLDAFIVHKYCSKDMGNMNKNNG